jgi:hypothetical protein
MTGLDERHCLVFQPESITPYRLDLANALHSKSIVECLGAKMYIHCRRAPT